MNEELVEVEELEGVGEGVIDIVTVEGVQDDCEVVLDMPEVGEVGVQSCVKVVVTVLMALQVVDCEFDEGEDVGEQELE